MGTAGNAARTCETAFVDPAAVRQAGQAHSTGQARHDCRRMGNLKPGGGRARARGGQSASFGKMPRVCASVTQFAAIAEKLTFQKSTHTRLTGVAYDVAERGSRMALLDNYSDGHSPLYMIAVTHVQETISEERAVLAAMDRVALGRVPFLGRWVSGGVAYEDVSFAADHGITDKDTTVLLKRLKQKAALKITHDGYRAMFSLGSHGVSYGA